MYIYIHFMYILYCSNIFRHMCFYFLFTHHISIGIIDAGLHIKSYILLTVNDDLSLVILQEMGLFLMLTLNNLMQAFSALIQPIN